MMKVTIHRGTQEIGGTCVELRHVDAHMVLDLGMPLVKRSDPGAGSFDADAVRKMTDDELRASKLLPDIPGLYRWDTVSSPVAGLVISHAHLDHYGMAGRLREDVPVFCSGQTAAILEVSRVFLRGAPSFNDLRTKPFWRTFEAGPFTVKLHLADHSSPGSAAVEVRAGGRCLLYSGDFRAHGWVPTIYERFLEHAPRDVDLLLLEGTALGDPDRPFESESEIADRFRRLVEDKEGLGVVWASGQNLDRLRAIREGVDMARLKVPGARFVIDPYTAWVLYMANEALEAEGHPRYHPDARSDDCIRVLPIDRYRDKLRRHGHGAFVDSLEGKLIDMEALVHGGRELLVLARWEVEQLLLERDPTDLPAPPSFVWSLWDSYLKKRHYRDKMPTILHLEERHGVSHQSIHTSGHAAPKDLRRLVETIHPRRITPIHTFEPDELAVLLSDAPVEGARDGEVIEL